MPKRMNRLATIAIIGVVFFAASATLLPLVSEYSFAGDHISELAIGKFDYVPYGPGRLAWGQQKRPPEKSGGRTLLSVTQVSRFSARPPSLHGRRIK